MSCHAEKCCSSESNSNSCSTPSAKASCDSKESCCPIEKMVHMLEHSFCEAMQCVVKDMLKKEIEKRWGQKLTREVEAVIKSKEAQWESMMAAGKAKEQLHAEIRNIIMSK